MPMNLGLGLGLGRQQLLGSLPSYTISNGNGVSGVPTIIYVSGNNWSVSSTGPQGVSGPWSVTTAQLASGLPILLAAPVITTAAGPIFSVTAGANDPLFLSPSLDLPEYAYQWYWNSTKLVATGRSYDATGQGGILVEFVVTATNFNGATISRFVAQAATAFTETLTQWGSTSLLVNATGYASGTPLTFGFVGVLPNPVPSTFLYQGMNGFSGPILQFNGDGTGTYNFGATGNFSGIANGERMAWIISLDTTHCRIRYRHGTAAWTTVRSDANGNGILQNTAQYIGQLSQGGGQYTGKSARFFLAPQYIDLDVQSNLDAFIDPTTALVTNPIVFRSLFTSYGFDLCGNVAAMNAGTNPGTLGTFTKSGAAFA